MEEIFLKILEEKIEGYSDLGADIVMGRHTVALEIADIVKAFVEWKDKECFLNKPSMCYRIRKDIYRLTFSIDELFEFWYNEIREKL